MKKYIITGGPHSGKTKVLKLLEKQGIPVLHETARLLILEDQKKKATDPSFKIIYPWEDQTIFCGRCHTKQLEREKALTGDLVIMDRSIIDNLAYARVEGIELDKKTYIDIKKAGYEKKVFYLEQLKDYKKDDQRKDSEKQVKAVHKELYKTYTELGFELITLPIFSDDKKTNIMKRAEAILKQIPKKRETL